MGKTGGFMQISRKTQDKRPVADRVADYREFVLPLPLAAVRDQGARCMDCGVAFCHSGCPLGNLIPEWNDLVYRDDWHAASVRLHATNNFPELTGRLCPAPCEPACVLAINAEPVAIKTIEQSIIERAFQEGWVRAEPPASRTGKKVAVIGSGPAGLAAAQQLNRAGHWVTVYEKADKPGGLLRYGIPDFKLEKWVLDRRIDLMTAEGVSFETNTEVGRNIGWDEIRIRTDAIILAIGAEQPRDLAVPGRELRGIHFAMEYLPQQNRRVAGEDVPQSTLITARGKRVVILGGGDTGADCLGNVHREGCSSVAQFEIMAKPPLERPDGNPWPQWPLTLRTSAAHEEGGLRDYNIQTTHFSGDDAGNVTALHGVRLESDDGGLSPISGEFSIDCDLVLIAAGFVSPRHDGLIEQEGLSLNSRGTIQADGDLRTSIDGVFVAGDAHRGASLIVWAIAEGRRVAASCDAYVMETSPRG